MFARANAVRILGFDRLAFLNHGLRHVFPYSNQWIGFID